MPVTLRHQNAIIYRGINWFYWRSRFDVGKTIVKIPANNHPKSVFSIRIIIITQLDVVGIDFIFGLRSRVEKRIALFAINVDEIVIGTKSIAVISVNIVLFVAVV